MNVLSFDQLDELLELEAQHPEWTVNGEGTEQVRAGVFRHLAASVVLRQYVGHLNRRDSLPRNRFGWHAEGERCYAAFMLATVGTEHGARLLTVNGEPLEPGLAVGMAMNALMAQVYLWSDDIESLADATPMPPHVVSRDALQFPVMFWSRETAHTGPDWETNWLLVMHSVSGIRIAADVMRGGGDASIMVGDIPYGARYPDDFKDEEIGPGPVLARLSFLASPYIAADTERLPRQWRREAERAGVPASSADPLIRIVKLRREAQESIDRQRQDASTPMERRSHWWVSGHHRAQWYPSKQAHEVIWIAPHLKGDLSKPLAQKVYGVVR